MAKNNNIWIFVGIGILLLAIIFLPQLQKKDIVPGITVTYYDTNGNEIIKQSDTFSLGKLFPQKNIVNDYTTKSSLSNSSLISSQNNFFTNFLNDIKMVIGLGNFAISNSPSVEPSFSGNGGDADIISLGEETDKTIKNETTGEIVRLE
jgi:hypothetical protein